MRTQSLTPPALSDVSTPEEEGAVAQARFHTLAYMLQDAVLVIDRAGLIRFANPAADQLLNAGAGSLIGIEFAAPLTQREGECLTLTLLHGGQITVHTHIAPTSWQGEAAWLVTLRPDTAQGRDAHDATLARRRLLAHVSHELRTPLNSIVGFAEVMAGEILGPLGTPGYRDYARAIHTAGDRLMRMIDDLLDLSTADVDDLSLQESVFDLSTALNEAATLGQTHARNGGASQIHTLPQTEALIRGDRPKLVRALAHLIANGLEHAPASTALHLSARLSNDGRLLVRITDEGDGFAPSALARAFQPFCAQGDPDLANPQRGPGLGLAVARQLFEVHGGALRVDSRKGKGATITGVLPATRVILSAPAHPRHRQTPVNLRPLITPIAGKIFPSTPQPLRPDAEEEQYRLG